MSVQSASPVLPAAAPPFLADVSDYLGAPERRFFGEGYKRARHHLTGFHIPEADGAAAEAPRLAPPRRSPTRATGPARARSTSGRTCPRSTSCCSPPSSPRPCSPPTWGSPSRSWPASGSPGSASRPVPVRWRTTWPGSR
ncbi:AvrD family protein [Streptomyces diastatochromogenes]|nr:AvrD family protein [Streptomyces diastatochromogenes]